MTELQATIIIAELFGIFWILLGMFFGISRRQSPQDKDEVRHGRD